MSRQLPAYSQRIDSTPRVWTVAGTDPSGCAGISADLKTMNALGVHGCAVIAALIAQNSRQVQAIEYPSAEMLTGQLNALREEGAPASVKLGMLANAETIRIVSEHLRDLDAFVVCDPVLVSSSGTTLLEPEAFGVFRGHLLPRVDLLTPNLPEAEALLNRSLKDHADIESAAHDLRAMGARAVLVKGGHTGADVSQDFWTDGTRTVWLTLPRLNVSHTHGTGCVLSSAIAACVALGYTQLDAVTIARAYLHQALRTGGPVGHGAGAMRLGGWPADPTDLPRLTDTAKAGARARSFPACGPAPIGLYPIVDRAARVEKLLALGITTIQLRIKDLAAAELEREVQAAANTARAFPNSRLFINDAWEPAIKYGAYGVHLGQDDLAEPVLDAIESAGLRLGISTHSYAEIARARAYHPSYVAIGTVFPTDTKVMDYPALGLDEFARLRRLLDVPAVAIGGIDLECARSVLERGADGIAVISAIRDTTTLQGDVAAWRQLFERHRP